MLSDKRMRNYSYNAKRNLTLINLLNKLSVLSFWNLKVKFEEELQLKQIKGYISLGIFMCMNVILVLIRSRKHKFVFIHIHAHTCKNVEKTLADKISDVKLFFYFPTSGRNLILVYK